MSEAETAAQAATTDSGAATGDTGAASSSSGRERGADGKFVAKAAATGAEGDGGAKTGGDAGQTETASTVQYNWRDSILDPAQREFADRLASPADAVKAAFDMRREASKYVKLLGKDPQPEEVEAWRNAVGAGKDADAYLKAIPAPAEGAEYSETDKALHTATAAVLHKHNVPVAAMAELGTVVSELVAGFEAEQDRLAKQGRENAEAELRKEWGRDFEANKQLAIRAVQTFGTPALRDFLNERHVDGVKLGDHPEIIRFMGQIGRRVGEGQFIGAADPGEQKSLKQQLDEIYQQNPIGSEGYRNMQGKIRELNVKLYGTAPGDGRAA